MKPKNPLIRLGVRILPLFFVSLFGFSQAIPPKDALDSHMFFVSQLSNAKDQNFHKILAAYDTFIANNPANVQAQIERCKFLGNAYWDVYEEYNLKYEETEECIAALYHKYPEHPAILLYRAENLYGEERMEVLLAADKHIKADKTDWSKKQRAAIYHMLGDAQEAADDFALAYFLKAQKEDHDLDLSLDIANIYQRQGKTPQAKKILLPALEKDTAKWVMNRKALLLLDLNEPEKALELFNTIAQRDSTYIDKSEMATVFADLGDYDLARDFLVQDTLQDWNRVLKLQKLFDHDLAHSDPQMALDTYRRLQLSDSNDDFFGIKRLRLALKAPFLPWKASELLHLFFFIIAIFLLLLIPYLWVLPLHSIGGLLRNASVRVNPKLGSIWSTRHFWLISFLYLLAQYLTIVVFEYDTTINYYFDIGNYYEEEVENTGHLATTMLFYVITMAIFTLFMLNKRSLKQLFGSNLGWLRMLSLGVGFVIFNSILLRFLGKFIDLSEADAFGVLFSAKREILAILRGYGFAVTVLAAAIVVPIYEEIIFRGIVLGSVEKQVGFVAANIFQSILFALIHYDLKLFVFYFCFGMVTGHFASRTGGLLTGIILHAVNNFVVVTVLYYTL